MLWEDVKLEQDCEAKTAKLILILLIHVRPLTLIKREPETGVFL